MFADSVVDGHARLGEERKQEIQQQLDRLLADPHFSRSRRFPSFLSYVTEKTLSGDEDSLKERTLGVEIFGRSPDYDTAADPIVRVTAAEIRKRIAQYYQEPGHEQELRISLPPGSYVPQFQWPTAAPAVQASEPAAAASASASPAERGLEARPQRWLWPAVAAVCVLSFVLIAAGFRAWRSSDDSAFKFFWGPVVDSSDPVLVCVADQREYSSIALRDSADPNRQVILPESQTEVFLDDVNAMMKVGGILEAHNKKYTLRGEGGSTLNDLRDGPTIFIGAFDNAWTLRLTRPLRYHFFNNPAMTQFAIVDSNAPPANRPIGNPWTVDQNEQIDAKNYRDYALVARFTDNTTGKLEVVAAGIGRGGTIAAGEFVTDSRDLAKLMNAARAAGNKQNMEAVLSTQIIDGEPGSPRIEATYFW